MALKSSENRILLVNMPRKSPSRIGTIEQTNKELESLGRRKVNMDLSHRHIHWAGHDGDREVADSVKRRSLPRARNLALP